MAGPADIIIMHLEPIHTVWPILAILVYAFTMCMVRVLSAKLTYRVRLHNRVCEARNMRRQYLEGFNQD